MSVDKLVVIGGSSPNTLALFWALADAGGPPVGEICLVGRSEEKVENTANACRALCQERGLDLRVTWDTCLRTAAWDATHVLNVLRVGGSATLLEDRRALAASGVVGHAASYLEALRHLPPTLEAVSAVHAVAPHAVFINFTNPVSILCEAIAQNSELTCVGLCHHAFAMATDFARLLQVPASGVQVHYLGLNHVGWVTDVLVDGVSRMSCLVQRLIERRVKAYDFDLIRAFNAIPIKHAAALYYKGEVLFVRQSGPRASLADLALRYGARRLATWTARAGAGTQRPAAWYANCIVPFLRTLAEREPREHIVTWKHAGRVPGVAGETAETTALVADGCVSWVTATVGLPDAAQEWLRQVRNSELLLIRAASQRSPRGLIEALAVHPNVASVAHADAFVRRTASTWLQDV